MKSRLALQLIEFFFADFSFVAAASLQDDSENFFWKKIFLNKKIENFLKTFYETFKIMKIEKWNF